MGETERDKGLDEPSVVGMESPVGNALPRSADASAPKPDESDDAWYVRTGQPAPNRADGDPEPMATEGADAGEPVARSPLVPVAAAAVVIFFVLIVLFGVLMG